jgi:long-subunit fatty acid transport protein
VRFAYPFPTFRGNLVVGISGNRVHGFDDDFLAAYEDSLTWEESEGEFLTAPWTQVEDHITEGGIYAWTLAGAFDASPGVSLGASVSYWTGDFSRRFIWSAADDVQDASDAYDSFTRETTSEADVSGLRAKVSGLFYVSESLAAGIVIDSPVTLTFEGMERVHEERVYEAAPPSDSTYNTYFADELKLPFTLAAGAAYTPNDLLAFAADVVYTDWSEMTYEGFLYLDDPTARVRAYEATTDIRVGVEATVPSWPLRLRAGYMTRPIAYQGLEVDQNRSYFTLGAGVLVDTVFAIDVAWMGGAFERSGRGYDYSEQVDDTAFIVEAAYRF